MARSASSSRVTVAGSRSTAALDPGLVDLELDGVEHHLAGGLGDVDVDVDRALEGGRLEVGREGEGVAPREDRARQAMGVGHGARLLGVLGPLATSRCAQVTPRSVPIRRGGRAARPPVASAPVTDTGESPGETVDELDVVGIGNALVDVLSHEDDAFIEAQRAGEGVDDPHRHRPGRGALRGHGRCDRGVRAARPPTRSRASPASAGRPPTSAGSSTTSSAPCSPTTCGPPASVFRCAARHRGPAHRPLPDRRHARRRAHDEHLPRRLGVPRPRGRRRRPDRGGPGHLPRGLPLRPARGAGGVLEGEPDRPRRRPPGQPHPVRHASASSATRRPGARSSPTRSTSSSPTRARPWRSTTSTRVDGGARAREGRRGDRAPSPAGRRARSSCTHGEVIEIPAHPAEQVVDTTGAGDLYAAGFLYGYTAGKPLEALRPARLDGGHRGARPHRAPPGPLPRPAGRARSGL